MIEFYLLMTILLFSTKNRQIGSFEKLSSAKTTTLVCRVERTTQYFRQTIYSQTLESYLEELDLYKNSNRLNFGVATYRLDTFQDFLIAEHMKPRMHTVRATL